MNAQKVFENLAKKGMFITSSDDFENSDVMLLKNQKDEYNISLAEMNLQVKNKISHRAKAFERMISFLNEYIQ